MPSFDANSRYTVACGVSERSLIASMVVDEYPRSRKSDLAVSTTAARVRRVLAWRSVLGTGRAGLTARGTHARVALSK